MTDQNKQTPLDLAAKALWKEIDIGIEYDHASIHNLEDTAKATIKAYLDAQNIEELAKVIYKHEMGLLSKDVIEHNWREYDSERMIGKAQAILNHLKAGL